MLKQCFIGVLLMLAAMVPTYAQWGRYLPDGTRCDEWMKDSLAVKQWEPHLSVSTGFIGNSWGDNRVYTSVSPSLLYRANKRLVLEGGFGIVSDFGLDRNYTVGSVRSLAPRRQNGGTGLIAAHAGVEYQVNDRLWLSAWIYHVGGLYAPFYGPARGDAFDVSVTALSAAAAYRLGDRDLLHVSLTVLRDNRGTLPYLMHDTWMSHGWGGWGF